MRTTPTSLLLLFILYKFLVCMMIKFRITNKKEKEEETIKRSQQNVKVFFLSIKDYVKRSEVVYF